MSKEHAGKFLAFMQGDGEIKKKIESISEKYEGKELTEKERDKIILEEVIPLAKSICLDFTIDEFHEVLMIDKKELTDEELDKTVGGKGYFRRKDFTIFGEAWYQDVYCDRIPDDMPFQTYFYHGGCPYFYPLDPKWPDIFTKTRNCPNCLYIVLQNVT